MAGNQFGTLFSITTFGESHGLSYGCVIDGCPAGLELSVNDIQPDLDRRRPGRTRVTSQRREPDTLQILSGIYEGKTTGTPIGLLVHNVDSRPRDYEKIQDQLRPGHADFTYQHKYGIRDPRGGGRSSARETLMRVAAGAIAKKWLRLKFGIAIQAYVAQIGNIVLPFIDADYIEKNDFFCADPSKISELEDYIQSLRKQGDSIGARVNVFATNVPVGLGEPVYHGLDAELARAFMSINAAKGVEIGAGFNAVEQLGSQHRDVITPTGFLSNHSGGTLGGISTGQDILASVAFKPASSIPIPVQSIDKNNAVCTVRTTGRHDPCVGIRAVPVVEAMLALVLMDYCLLQSIYQLA